MAAKYNRKNSVLWLLQNGTREDGTCLVDTTAKDNKGRNAIHLAVLDMKCGSTIDVGTCMCMTSTSNAAVLRTLYVVAAKYILYYCDFKASLFVDSSSATKRAML